MIGAGGGPIAGRDHRVGRPVDGQRTGGRVHALGDVGEDSGEARGAEGRDRAAVQGAVPGGVAAEEAQGLEVGESGRVGREQQRGVSGDQPGSDRPLVEEFRRPGDDQTELPGGAVVRVGRLGAARHRDDDDLTRCRPATRRRPSRREPYRLLQAVHAAEGEGQGAGRERPEGQRLVHVGDAGRAEARPDGMIDVGQRRPADVPEGDGEHRPLGRRQPVDHRVHRGDGGLSAQPGRDHRQSGGECDPEGQQQPAARTVPDARPSQPEIGAHA